MTNRKKLDM